MSEPLVPLRDDERDEVGQLLARGSRSLRTPPMPPELRAKILRSSPAKASTRLGWLKGGGIAVGCFALLVGTVRLFAPIEQTSSPPENLRAEPFVTAQPVVPEAEEVPTTSVMQLPNASPAAPTVMVARPPRPPPIAGDSLAREVELLERARASPEPSEKLALLDQHGREFPNGKLALEREVFAVQTLLHAGRTKEAELRGRAVLAKDPESPHAARVKELLR